MLTLIAGLTLTQTAVQSEHKFTKVIRQTVTLKYLASVPKDYAKAKTRFPVLVFLHGSGERGEDISKVKSHGPPMLVEKGVELPFIIISPQCPDGQWWDVRALSALLDEVEKKYRVDTDRVYLTGLSMGGYATWEWGGLEADRFAALIPICGGGSRTWSTTFTNMPIWCVHGDADGAVPISESQTMVKRAKSAGAHLRFTTVQGEGHGVWVDFYARNEWVDWLMQFKLSDRKAGKITPEYLEEPVQKGWK
ncbi:MAG: prolyl oligopeptidase family serine peptidase [Armatimonadetes bacterium]|nr:prolyl oligopeptidase family serine peptidase [Armatimonadota bacterium]